jgi:hypothetical protein
MFTVVVVLRRITQFLSSPVRSSLSHVKAALIPAAFTLIPTRLIAMCLPSPIFQAWLYEKCATVFRCEWLSAGVLRVSLSVYGPAEAKAVSDAVNVARKRPKKAFIRPFLFFLALRCGRTWSLSPCSVRQPATFI